MSDFLEFSIDLGGMVTLLTAVVIGALLFFWGYARGKEDTIRAAIIWEQAYDDQQQIITECADLRTALTSFLEGAKR